MKKYIAFDQEDGLKPEVFSAFENPLPKSKMSIFNIIILLIFSKRFRWLFLDSVKYALLHSDSYRGTYASSVVLLNHTYLYKIFKKEKGGNKK